MEDGLIIRSSISESAFTNTQNEPVLTIDKLPIITDMEGSKTFSTHSVSTISNDKTSKTETTTTYITEETITTTTYTTGKHSEPFKDDPGSLGDDVDVPKDVSTKDQTLSQFGRSTTYTGSTFTAFEYGTAFQGTQQNPEQHNVDFDGTSFSLDNLDDLLGGLTPDEIRELSVIDPDDSSLPPSLRCIYHCEKSPTIDFNRKKLVKELRETAINLPDRKENVQYVKGTIRGKRFTPKEGSKEILFSSTMEDLSDIVDSNADGELSLLLGSNLADLLSQADMEDLRTLADILGVTYQDHCCATILRVYPDPEPNLSNIEEIINNLENLNEVNLNNLRDIGHDRWKEFFDVLSHNTTVRICSLANCNITDLISIYIVNCIEQNSCLRSLTLDSNAISGEMVVKIIEATTVNKTLQELKCSNQLNSKFLGHRIESQIANLIEKTPQLVKLGITLEFRDTLNRTALQLQKNLDIKRQTSDRRSEHSKPMKKIKTRFSDPREWIIARQTEFMMTDLTV